VKYIIYGGSEAISIPIRPDHQQVLIRNNKDSYIFKSQFIFLYLFLGPTDVSSSTTTPAKYGKRGVKRKNVSAGQRGPANEKTKNELTESPSCALEPQDDDDDDDQQRRQPGRPMGQGVGNYETEAYRRSEIDKDFCNGMTFKKGGENVKKVAKLIVEDMTSRFTMGLVIPRQAKFDYNS